MIPFNKSPNTGNEEQHVLIAMRQNKLSGDGHFSMLCQHWFENNLPCKKALLTPSCTHALEMAAILLDIKADDEIIMPSYTFVSTANAFVLRGAKIVFVDIHPDTMNMNEALIESAITPKTKAIVPVHYAGVACDMDAIMAIANKHSLCVVEDAAQGMMSYYKGKALGTIGHLGTFSFHETKNFTSGGEGGLLIINDDKFVERAEIIREKGTNRSQFFRGMVDKYSWVDIGSSYLPSELQAAYLWGQLQYSDKITKARLDNWSLYYKQLKPLEQEGYIETPDIPKGCKHNAHMFYVKLKNLSVRDALIHFLNEQKIHPAFHYVPLHSSSAGQKLGRFSGEDKYTSIESERLLRLPMFYGLTKPEITSVTSAINSFFIKAKC